MRVAQLVETLEIGGAEKLAVEIAGARNQAGDKSYLITLAALGPLSSDIDPGVTVMNLGMNPHSLWSQATALFRLGMLLHRLKLDAVQTHLPRANYFGLALAIGIRLSVFPTVHNNREFDYGDNVGILRRKLRRLAYRRLLVHGRRMIAVSNAVKHAMVKELDLNAVLSERITVVSNGVAIPKSMTADQKAEVRKRFGVPVGDIMIASIGRLTPQKNFRDLILALGRMGPEVSDWHCVIVGSGPEREGLETLVQSMDQVPRIHFVGQIIGVDRILGSADIFCMSSLWEGLPLALLEAMASGLPVVAYDIEGVREVVIEGQTGSLVRSGQVEELAVALSRLVDDPASRFKMGNAGCNFVKQNHGFDQMAKRLGGIYAGRD